MWLWWSKSIRSHFGVGEFTTHFRTYFSGDWDVAWGYGILTNGQVFCRRFYVPQVFVVGQADGHGGDLGPPTGRWSLSNS